jgi:hypothetical protein
MVTTVKQESIGLMTEDPGWARPILAKKAHYFTKDKMSLCRKWYFSGNQEQGDPFLDSPDDCRECRRKFTAAYGTGPNTAGSNT